MLSLTGLHVKAFSNRTVRSTTDTSDVGTRNAMPVKRLVYVKETEMSLTFDET